MFGLVVLEAIALTFWVAGLAAVLHGVRRGRLERLLALLSLAAVVFIPVLGSALVIMLMIRSRLLLRAVGR